MVKQGKKLFLLTNFGTNLAQGNPSVVLPDNYNGFRIDNYNRENLESVLKTTDIPKEICYFKPQKDIQSFMKQAIIFKDIEKKPLLRDHPELSLEACVKIGSLYNIANDKNAPGKEAARAKLAEIEADISSKNPSETVKHIVENHSVLKEEGLSNVFKAYQQNNVPSQSKPQEKMFTIIAEGTLGAIAPISKLSKSAKRKFLEVSAEAIYQQLSQDGLLPNLTLEQQGLLKRQIQDVIKTKLEQPTSSTSLSTALDRLNKEGLEQVAQKGLAKQLAKVCSHYIKLAEKNPPTPAKPVEQAELQKKKVRFAEQVHVIEPSSESARK